LLQITPIPALQDNYIYLLVDSATDQTAVIDPGEAEPVMEALSRLGIKNLDYIFITHHHWDHTNGLMPLKEHFGCHTLGPGYDRHRIKGLDRYLQDQEQFEFGEHQAKVIYVPGHTTGHIAIYFEQAKALFPGDTLFSAGCGRLFEGTAEQMWDSLSRLRGLAEDTKVYPAHEYTEANLRFANSVEPNNEDIQQHQTHVAKLRAQAKPSLPSTIAIEKKINPFLRADLPQLRQSLKVDKLSDVEVFQMLRSQKDSFN